MSEHTPRQQLVRAIAPYVAAEKRHLSRGEVVNIASKWVAEECANKTLATIFQASLRLHDMGKSKTLTHLITDITFAARQLNQAESPAVEVIELRSQVTRLETALATALATALDENAATKATLETERDLADAMQLKIAELEALVAKFDRVVDDSIDYLSTFAIPADSDEQAEAWNVLVAALIDLQMRGEQPMTPAA